MNTDVRSTIIIHGEESWWKRESSGVKPMDGVVAYREIGGVATGDVVLKKTSADPSRVVGRTGKLPATHFSNTFRQSCKNGGYCGIILI